MMRMFAVVTASPARAPASASDAASYGCSSTSETPYASRVAWMFRSMYVDSTVRSLGSTWKR